MGKCLLTKLNGAVENDSLCKIGELRIHITSVDSPTTASQSISIGINAPISLEIIGDGYFTDSALSDNQGKTKALAQSGTVYFSNGNFDISISKKYVLNSISFGDSNKNKGIDLADLYACSTIGQLYIWGSASVGDYSDLKSLVRLQILNTTGISNIKGKLSDLANLTNLTGLAVSSIDGDLGSLSNCKNLESFNGSGNISGNLSIMPANFVYAEISSESMLNWTTRSSTSKIIAIGGNPLIDNIDKMLQDQAQGVIGYTGKPTWYKNISATGKRTSASDEAIATLQSKGYNVIINS